MGLPTFNVLSLCAGSGYFDVGLKLAVPNARTVCYVEIEAFQIESLVKAMQEDRLDEAPIWTDLKTFDGRAWRGSVDCVIGGYPCQPFSYAGQRLGKDDPRHLWPDVHRIVSETEPPLVFFENVAGHLSLGFDLVCEELEGLGFKVAAGLWSAKEVGASHRRDRLFIMGISESHIERWTREGRTPGLVESRGPGCGLENSDDGGRRGAGICTEQSRGAQVVAASSDDGLVNSQSVGRRKGRSKSTVRSGRGATGSTSGRLADCECDGRDKGSEAVREGEPEPGQRCGRLANSERPESKQRRGTGDVQRTSRCSEGEESERQRSGRDACDCGERLAYSELESRCSEQWPEPRQRTEASPCDEPMLDADCQRLDDTARPRCSSARKRTSSDEQSRECLPCNGCRKLGNSERARRTQAGPGPSLDTGAQSQPGSIPLYAPGRNAYGLWRDILADRPELAPALSEAEAQRAFRGVPDGLDAWKHERIDRLRSIGNGVEPVSAGLAFASLFACLIERER